MANQPNQKLKLLYVLKTLLDKTDDVNGVTTQDLIEELAYYDIDAERKSINRDIQTLRDFGFDIQQRSHKYWYLANRPLELQEMIMLVDAVQSAPFLTDKLTDELIERIKQFASIDQRKMLARRIEVPGRIKMQNERVLESLDIIQQAMRCKRKVEFQYFQYDLKKKRVARKGGNTYLATPVRLVYADEFYYLVTFNDYWAEHGGNAFTPYRVDRMMNVQVSEEVATKDPRIANYHTEEHISPSFGVYAADKVTVILEVDQSAMNPIIDKFGIDALVFEKEADRAQVHVKAPLSPQFYGWLLQLGPLVKITYPQRVVEEFSALLERTQSMYKGSYRICTDTARRSISQEQFLEFVEYLRVKLDAYVAGELGGLGFESENDFDAVALKLADDWLHAQGISDGMPLESELRQVEVRGKKRTVMGPINHERYLVYGQIVGEVLIALDPRNYASEAARESFTDVSAYSSPRSGLGFTFSLLPKQSEWEKVGHERRYELGHGAHYDLCLMRREGEKWLRSHAYFTAPDWRIDKVELEPWLGTFEDSGAMKAILKHWQMIAYRFA